MQLTHEQKIELENRFNKDIEEADMDDVEYAAKKGRTKLEQLSKKPPAPLLEIWNEIKTMINLLIDFVTGKYKEVPWRIIAAIAGAIIYFVSPIDIIPDFLPGGYLEDATVIWFARDLAMDDLSAYLIWRENREAIAA
jgi:uncharacterized membrane protein YkvA (DUF1232 family)